MYTGSLVVKSRKIEARRIFASYRDQALRNVKCPCDICIQAEMIRLYREDRDELS